MSHELLFWIGFNLFVVAMLAIDLGVLNRKAHVVHFREAITWTGVWIALALSFAVGVFFWRGKPVALEFTTGYLVELALSVDNLFVFLLVFRFFKVPGQFQHKVLFWGILGALIMRGVFIYAGVALINRFHWIIYVFGAFLVYTGIKLAFQKEAEVHPEQNPVVRWFRRIMPVTKDYVGGKFFVRSQMGRAATPLFLVLIVVETTDVLFAADSIPAILAITHDPFIVYTSNVFAIMGLRSMYFALSGMMDIFHHLHYGLSAILSFIGVKMLISNYVKIPTGWALGIVAGVLALSILASVLFPKKEATLVRAEGER
jgi:tellurite resistance protein TerC